MYSSFLFFFILYFIYVSLICKSILHLFIPRTIYLYRHPTILSYTFNGRDRKFDKRNNITFSYFDDKNIIHWNRQNSLSSKEDTILSWGTLLLIIFSIPLER